ncbi:MAG: type II toxin-antitoxin system RelE family toxin [Pseudonocardia sp.]
MPRYGPVWLEIALEQYASLPPEAREQVGARIEQLLEDPRQPMGGYDELTDQWTTIYGGGAGLIVYAVVHERQRVIILRLV